MSDERPAATKPTMRYRSLGPVAVTRWNPGWTLKVGRLSVNWHHLTVWRWGHDPRFAGVRTGCVHFGKRLVTWGLR